MQIEQTERGPMPWVGTKPTPGGLFEYLGEWQSARTGRWFLIRSRQFSGYRIEIVQDIARYEIQADSVADALHQVAEVLALIDKMEKK